MFHKVVWLHSYDMVDSEFLAECNGERILTIDQHLKKLLKKNVVGLFL